NPPRRRERVAGSAPVKKAGSHEHHGRCARGSSIPVHRRRCTVRGLVSKAGARWRTGLAAEKPGVLSPNITLEMTSPAAHESVQKQSTGRSRAPARMSGVITYFTAMHRQN